MYSTLDLPFAVSEAYREEQAAESVPPLLSDTYKVTSTIDDCSDSLSFNEMVLRVISRQTAMAYPWAGLFCPFTMLRVGGKRRNQDVRQSSFIDVSVKRPSLPEDQDRR